ncbi:MAG: aspartate aminotransferase family protein [Sphingobacteriaceae bacterium]|nr:aspartate aminotransferase family protein [Sphingobacteriaceae bacterium]
MNQRELFLKHVAQTSYSPMMGIDLNIVSAQGSVLVDVNGKSYVDLISGISVSSIGHCHPKVVKAIHNQASKYMHLMVYGEYNQTPQVKYAQVISSHLPSNLNCVYFTTGGSEAVEGAMKLAKRVTGRTKFISFKNAYHGSTQGALSLMGDEYFKNSFRPLLPGVEILEFNNINDLNKINTDCAAVFIEPIQGEAGVIEATVDFLKALQIKCKETETLLVFDEIQTGFGRTGKLFAFEHFNIEPDILLVAKAMGGGLPIGAFISSKENMNHFCDNPVLGHINTFGGNAVCVEAALASLNVVLEDKLVQRAMWIENFVKFNLKNPRIKFLRMKGALGAIEFESVEFCQRVIKKCIENGVISDWFLFCDKAMRIAPPLNIEEADLSHSLKIINNSINDL